MWLGMLISRKHGEGQEHEWRTLRKVTFASLVFGKDDRASSNKCMNLKHSSEMFNDSEFQDNLPETFLSNNFRSKTLRRGDDVTGDICDILHRDRDPSSNLPATPIPP